MHHPFAELTEVIIESKGRADSQAAHQNEARTVHETEAFIPTLLKQRPCFSLIHGGLPEPAV